MYPLARTEKLSVQELAQETLVCDLERNKYHCLNRTSGLIWRHCDGRHSVADLARLVHAELGLPADESIVHLALEQLERRSLLQRFVKSGDESRRSRRDMLKKLALAAAALPVVMTATAKAAAAQTSAERQAAQDKTFTDACQGKTSGTTVACANLCFSLNGSSAKAHCNPTGFCQCD